MSAGPQLPYPGLRPFEEADHPLFFGREEQVGGLLGLLEDASLVAVVGASGSGKSSLVKAGLLPVVRQGFLLGTEDWIVAVARPGEEPYGCLAHQLAAVLPAAEPELLQALRRSDRGLVGACELAKVGAETRFLVVVDQFEELFGFRRAVAGAESPISRDQAAAFVAMLLRTAAEPEGRIRVILTMRSDFIGDCEAFLGLPEAISRSQFLVPRLTRSQMEEAILRPGQVEGAAYEPFGFEEGLVNRIVNDAGDRPDQLPLMQHALMRTWKRAGERHRPPSLLRHVDYEDVGTIEKALSNDAESALGKLEIERPKEIARRMFLLLSDVSPDGQITRRRPLVSEVMEVAAASRDEVERVVRVFQSGDRNFLLPAADQPFEEGSHLDVSHEALLRRWERFQAWRLEESRDAAELRRLAEQAELKASGEGGLIPAADLSRVRAWQKRVSPAWSRRYAPEAIWNRIADFVKASRQRLRVLGCFGALVVILILATTAFSIYFAIRAREAKAKVESTLVESFWRTIGVEEDSSFSSDEERVSAWDLAELNSPAIRKRLVEKWFQSEAAFARGNRRQGLALRAAGDLEPALRAQIQRAAAPLAQALLARLQENPADAPALAETAAALFGRLDPEAAGEFRRRLLAWVASLEPAGEAQRLANLAPLLERVLARADKAETASFATRLALSLERAGGRAVLIAGEVPAVLADYLEPAQAARLAKRIAALSEEPSRLPQGDPAAVIERLALRLDPDGARALANHLTEGLERMPRVAGPNDSWRILAALAGRLDAQASTTFGARFAALVEPGAVSADQSLAMRSTSRLLEPAAVSEAARRLALQFENHPLLRDRLPLSAPLAELLDRLEPAEAERLSADALGLMVAAMETEVIPDRPSYLLQMETMAAHLTLADVEVLAKRLSETKSLTNRQDIRPVALLGALASRLPSPLAEKYADLLVAVLLENEDWDSWPDVAEALARSAKNLEPAAAVRLFDRLAEAAGQDEKRSCWMGAALAGLANRLEEPQKKQKIARLAEAQARAMDREHSALQISNCGRSLATLASPLGPASSRTQLFGLANWLVVVYFPTQPEEAPEQNAQRRHMTTVLASLSDRQLVEVLKWPHSVGEVEPMILAALEKKISARLNRPVSFGGEIDSFLDQAESLGIENHKTPSRRPRLADVQEEMAGLLR